ARARRAPRPVRSWIVPGGRAGGGGGASPRGRERTLGLTAVPHRALTLSQFLLQEGRDHPDATGEFTTLLTDIALPAKMINREVIRAGLVDILGYPGGQNVHGEKVQKLDRFAHETIYRVLGATGQLAVLASEEDEDVIPVPAGQPVGKYVVNFDPLDG